MKKYLEEENKWLWYYHIDADEDADFIEIKQYDKKGELIARSSAIYPAKKYRPKHPSEIKTNMFIRP